MQTKNDVPFTFGVNILEARMDRYDNHITRKLSSMNGQYFDTHAFEAMLAESDQLLYEVYETRRSEVAERTGSSTFPCTSVHMAIWSWKRRKVIGRWNHCSRIEYCMSRRAGHIAQ